MSTVGGRSPCEVLVVVVVLLRGLWSHVGFAGFARG